ncbi:STAS domain-containing protein [Streptomyces sp. NPDC001568]|uniref:STAS domain-containing protein n=1 Tax=Streptomyces sp. NPDC001568 TaxID=3364588 RepID=UPI00369F0283
MGQDRQAGTTVVRVTGETDLESAQRLRTELETAIVQAPGDVVVDLTGLVFCDSSGLNALLAARLLAQERGRVLRLAGPSRQVLRLLEMTGAKDLFPIDAAPPA